MSILLIEDDRIDAQRVRDTLAAIAANRPGGAALTLHCADRVSAGLARLLEGGIDVVLSELFLPDGTGLETLVRLRQHAQDVPIVVLTDLEDEALAMQAIQAGAEDCLVKARLTGDCLVRAIRYARERHRRQQAIRNLALVDPLTGLCNRRGFFTLAEQLAAGARRSGERLACFLVDLDGLKHINDTFGHQAGDRALAETAAILRKTFRNSDVLARLGGDEFAVLSVSASPAVADLLVNRLREHVSAYNQPGMRDQPLSLSVGVAVSDGDLTGTLEQLIATADSALYVEKREKRSSRIAPRAERAPEGVVASSVEISGENRRAQLLNLTRRPELSLADASRVPAERAD